MTNLIKYYPINSVADLNKYLDIYIPLVFHYLKNFDISIGKWGLSGDHLGLQVLSTEEFDSCHKILIQYSEMIHDSVIHDRRNRVYRFNNPIISSGVMIPRIEIFEPKPNAEISKLRAGIEHIAFVVEKYEQLLIDIKSRNIPIAKEVSFEGNSSFIKTNLINNIEIEFRNDCLGEW